MPVLPTYFFYLVLDSEDNNHLTVSRLHMSTVYILWTFFFVTVLLVALHCLALYYFLLLFIVLLLRILSSSLNRTCFLNNMHELPWIFGKYSSMVCVLHSLEFGVFPFLTLAATQVYLTLFNPYLGEELMDSCLSQQF